MGKLCQILFLLLFSMGVSRAENAAKIEYLSYLPLEISMNGINHLHFEKERIIKIIGDNSKYKAYLSDNGSDLYLTSKLPSPEIINLSLVMANKRVVDLRLKLLDMSEEKSINISLRDKKKQVFLQKKDAEEMIRSMDLGIIDKYFVKKEKRVVNHSDMNLRQYVSYRWKKLVGAGFYYSKVKKSLEKSKIIEEISLENFKGIFKDIVMIGLSPDLQGDAGRLFVIFKNEDN